MLNVGAINEGFVLDHIPAGEGMEIYRMLGLDKLDCGVAIIRNATSSKMGRKDILKAECPIDSLDMNILDILGFIAPQHHRQHHRKCRYRGEKEIKASRPPHQRDPMHQSPVHHFH